MKYRVYFTVPSYAYIVVDAPSKAAATRKATKLVNDELRDGSGVELENWDTRPDIDDPRHAWTVKEK